MSKLWEWQYSTVVLSVTIQYCTVVFSQHFNFVRCTSAASAAYELHCNPMRSRSVTQELWEITTFLYGIIIISIQYIFYSMTRDLQGTKHCTPLPEMKLWLFLHVKRISADYCSIPVNLRYSEILIIPTCKRTVISVNGIIMQLDFSYQEIIISSLCKRLAIIGNNSIYNLNCSFL